MTESDTAARIAAGSEDGGERYVIALYLRIATHQRAVLGSPICYNVASAIQLNVFPLEKRILKLFTQ